MSAYLEHRRRTTRAQQEAFLPLMARYGNVTRAVEALNQCGSTGDRRGSLSRSTVYHWLKEDPSFSARFNASAEQFADGLESMAMARLQEPQGNRGGDVLLMFMLNAHRPEKYRPTGAGSGAQDSREALSAIRVRLQSGSDGSADLTIESATRTE